MKTEWLTQNGTIFYDGGMGTMLMKRGMTPGMRSDLMNILHPEVVEQIHREYVQAGSGILCTNTFSSCSETLKGSGYSAWQVISAAVEAAKRASEGKAVIAMDIGPTGELLEPYGDMEPEDAYARFREQAMLGEKAGAELAAVETMTDPEEWRLAVTAVAENTKLPVLGTMSFREDGRTFMGFSVEDFGALANELPVIAAGMNCSQEPAKMLPAAQRLAAVLKKPLIIKLNAGMPDAKGEYSVKPEEYARQLLFYRDLGVKIIGGCCGTTPEHIQALKEIFK